MKASSLLILAFLISLSTSAKWEEINSNSTENLNCIQFINTIGYAAGQNGELLKTTNSGTTWTSLNSTTTDDITAIHFITTTTGFFTSSTGKVFKTTNGGSSWSNKQLQSIGALNGIDFQDSQIGLTVGDNGYIFRTIDAGATWTDLGNVSVFVVNDVKFINDTLALAIGAQGSILSSSDAGENWNYKGISSSNTFSAIEKLDDANAGIVGTGGVYVTFNAETMTASSETIIDNENDWLKDIHLAPSGKLYAAGFSQSILVTNPGWKTWDLDSINNLNGIYFMNDTIGFACGNNGKIYKTVTAGFPIGKEEISIQKLKVFPNPAVDYIQFEIPENLLNQSMKLTVYTSRGQIVDQKLISQGYYSVQNLSEGLYFISIQKGKQLFRSRFIKK